MSFEFIKKLPTPQEIREKYPLSEELAAIKKARDEEIRKVFTGAVSYTHLTLPTILRV